LAISALSHIFTKSPKTSRFAMQHQRSIFLFLASMLLLIGLGASCKRDKCKHVTCVNGTCVDGTCQCSTGYFREDCNSIVNVGYDGTWSLDEKCTAGADNYPVAVAAVPGSLTQIWLAGLWEQADTVIADFGADGFSLTLARQPLSNVELSGTGTINANRDEIELEYQVYFPGSLQAFDVCTATISKN
jgi:hypothetical protein